VIHVHFEDISLGTFSGCGGVRRLGRALAEGAVEIARTRDLSGYLRPGSAAFAGASQESKMSKLDSKGPHVGVVTVSADRGLTEMQELEAMAAKLLQTARKLPAGQVCRDILAEIGNFRVRISALKAREK
jgi:hypothetical protein